jgi:predicted Zn-dependent peptidase
MPASVKGVEKKGKVPVNPNTLKVQLPKPQEKTLTNGLRVALLEDHELPTFTMQLVVLSGGLSDPVDKRGLAMATAAMLREGTKQRSSREIAEQLATLGSSLNASASVSSSETSVSVSGLIENLDATLDIAADVIRNATFPQSELDKFRARFLTQLQYQRSMPSFLAQEQFMRAVYGEQHPASFIVPSEASLKALSSVDLAAYHARYFRPNNALLIVYGDLKLADLVRTLERSFGSWSKAEVPAVTLPPLSTSINSRIILVDRPGSVQTSLFLGSLGIERTHADYFPLLVMNHILGGSPASRLFSNLREDKGYTYGVSSGFSGSKYPGVVLTTTDVRTNVTEGAMTELAQELRRIGEEPVTSEELLNAKRALVGRFALSLDSPQTLIMNLVTQKVYGLPADYWDRYPQQVEAVTPADIQRVAKRYYDRTRLQIVAVGDSASVRPVLSKYGDVQVGADFSK